MTLVEKKILVLVAYLHHYGCKVFGIKLAIVVEDFAHSLGSSMRNWGFASIEGCRN